MKNLEDLDIEMRKFVAPALRWFQSKKFKILEIESTLVNKEEGYAGTVDLACLTPSGQKCIIDWKSRKTAGRRIVSYPGQAEQCSAYGAAYFGADAVQNGEVYGCNGVISTNELTAEGEAKFAVLSYTPAEMAKAYDTFCMTCEIWRRTEGYDPRKGCIQ